MTSKRALSGSIVTVCVFVRIFFRRSCGEPYRRLPNRHRPEQSPQADGGAPTAEVWVARKDYAENHPEVMAEFARVTLDSFANWHKKLLGYRAFSKIFELR